MIRRQKIAPGGRLPTEHALAKRFNVSRPIVREAIQALKVLGVVQSGPRVGLRVLPFDPAPIFNHLIPRIRTDEERGELYELRCILEPAILKLVYRRGDRKELETLEALLKKPLPRGRAAIHEGFRRDVIFHEGLWKMTGNQFVWSLRGLLVRYFADKERTPDRRITPAALRKANSQHLAIVRALLAGNLAKAEAALVRNLGIFRPKEKTK